VATDDDWTGRVEVGGPPAVREVPGLRITKIAVGPMDNNAYLLRCPATGEVLLVDAAAEPERLLAALDGDRLVRVVTTHRHADHWQGLQAVLEATGAPAAAHPLDAGDIGAPVAERLEDGDVVGVGRARLRVVHLVGHTPGSIALLYDAGGELADAPHLFTGDSLFPGGPGNTFGDSDAHARLMDDLEEKVFGRLPDATTVYPGHGADTTLGAERPSLEEWRARGW
jgi:glyoxylase-like metal-dependent hydrolase (beta-lactamase superfamily II)